MVACRKAVNARGDAVLEISRDITAQLKAEDALRKTERLAAMGRVAGIIAHEINNPGWDRGRRIDPPYLKDRIAALIEYVVAVS